ncbi:putative mrc1-like domain-containing protein [Erysiphe necator]|uniref:Putative mrc1-like domain-containing protein n=1 Tax=Uncinula necator TaxID=52586 RepID=A0A0B1P2F9_UNCNE|nr:putative mrc1-like domain-containing protein [Erysiphe necator]
MDPTRSSTPTRRDDGSSSPVLLTPNAKIKALLANLEEPEPITEGKSARDLLLATMSKSSSLSFGKDNPSHHTTSDEEGDINHIDLATPKGRIAASMKVNLNSNDLSDLENKPQNENKSTSFEPSIKSTFDTTAYDNCSDDGDNESDPVILKNRRKRITRRIHSPSVATGLSASPSLFVSPLKLSKSRSNSFSSDSDPFSEDFPKNPVKNSKFLALVQKKKEKQLALLTKTNKDILNKKEKNRNIQIGFENLEDTEDTEEELGHNGLLQFQPRRKASRKALEEINRETQRIMRQQQLSHKPMVKKKITKESLFSKFNFRPQRNLSKTRPTSSSSTINRSDSEVRETPPTSPLKSHNDTPKKLLHISSLQTESTVRERESLEKISDISPKPLSPSLIQPKENLYRKAGERNWFEIQYRGQNRSNSDLKYVPSIGNDYANQLSVDDSDSGLEIIEKKSSLQMRLSDIFDRAPVKKSREVNGFHALKMLAQLRSPPTKQKVNNSQINSTIELQIYLQQRARKQAAIEREERLEKLKAKGITIQTNEEREIDQANLDDLLTKARAEAEHLRKQELANKNKQRDKETELIDDTTEDEDWKEHKDMSQEDSNSSDSNDSNETGLSDLENNNEALNELRTSHDDFESEIIPVETSIAKDIDNILDEPDGISLNQNIKISNNITDQDDEDIIHFKRSHARNRIIISDDEEDIPKEGNTALFPTDINSSISSQIHPQTPSPITSNSVLRSATKTFIPGLPISGPAGLGLTQIFTGTMDDSQMPPAAFSFKSSSGYDSVDILRQNSPLPSSLLSPRDVSQLEQVTELSQISRIAESQKLGLNIERSQSHPLSLADNCLKDITQDAQQNQPQEQTQDFGFKQLTPIKNRFKESSSSPTNSTDYSAEIGLKAVKGKKKLYRKAPEIANFSDEETYVQGESYQSVDPFLQENYDSNLEANVFDILSKAGKKEKSLRSRFNKKESNTRDLFNEQAEESDDEYAGLGGLSDEPGSDEEDELIEDMIDDEGGEEVNEENHAAFFAERERTNNEKQIIKLYHDISKGMLRRKRGAEYELSDSDDDGDARRRRRRQEFIRMRKALLADERVSKIANNPKSQAFLQAIEDRGDSEEDYNFLFELEETEDSQDSQNQSQSKINSESQTGSTDNPNHTADTRSSRHFRPAATFKKPSSLSEIRCSLSNLLDDPKTSELVDFSSESGEENESFNVSKLDENLEDNTNEKSENLNSLTPLEKRPVVVDRISLQKKLAAPSSSRDSRLAFVSSSSTYGLKVPSLLRRTASSSVTSSTHSSTNSGLAKTTERAAGSESCSIRRGGTWGSGLNSFSRESERRAKMIRTESRREKKLVKGAISRRSFVSGLLGAGTFE